MASIPRMERCACSQLATIRTRVENARGTSYTFNCSDTCRNRWIEREKIAPRTIASTLFIKDGFKHEEPK